MKTWTHPESHKITALCTCGQKFKTESTLKAIKVESCSKCHNFYTWEIKETANSWRVARFRERQEAKSA